MEEKEENKQKRRKNLWKKSLVDDPIDVTGDNEIFRKKLLLTNIKDGQKDSTWKKY